jgi:hypothetical protein
MMNQILHGLIEDVKEGPYYDLASDENQPGLSIGVGVLF